MQRLSKLYHQLENCHGKCLTQHIKLQLFCDVLIKCRASALRKQTNPFAYSLLLFSFNYLQWLKHFFSKTKKFIQLKPDFSKRDLLCLKVLLRVIFQFQNECFTKNTVKNVNAKARFYFIQPNWQIVRRIGFLLPFYLFHNADMIHKALAFQVPLQSWSEKKVLNQICLILSRNPQCKFCQLRRQKYFYELEIILFELVIASAIQSS